MVSMVALEVSFPGTQVDFFHRSKAIEVSSEQNPLVTFCFTAWLIGILIMA